LVPRPPENNKTEEFFQHVRERNTEPPISSNLRPIYNGKPVSPFFSFLLGNILSDIFMLNFIDCFKMMKMFKKIKVIIIIINTIIIIVTTVSFLTIVNVTITTSNTTIIFNIII
jgi:hypothetical protein